jgi:hypothetical protein
MILRYGNEKYEFEVLEKRSGLTLVAELPEEYKDHEIIEIFQTEDNLFCIGSKNGVRVVFKLKEWCKNCH